ncbi:MAG: diaminopimelate decarboxylase [Rhodospirillales bacterium]|nr:diaminopimelate decarboxylase [Rhodospirillales bacterium]
MDHFDYQNGELFAEEVPLARIAETVGTPFYCYSTATLERHYKIFSEAFDDKEATVCFAVKANGNIAVLKTLGNLGAGADVVSMGELKRALAAGIPTDKIVFSGVGKTAEELAFAVEKEIFQINVESAPELETLSAVASSLGKEQAIAIRINPDVDAKTHTKIATGKSENKFGIEWDKAPEIFAKAAALPGIKVAGVAVHIGSQILDLKPFGEAFARMGDIIAALRVDGHDISRLDLGGGLGIPYEADQLSSPEDYATVVKETTAGLDCHLIFEPGRMIAGNAGVLVSKVVYVKEGETRDFAIVDAAMNDLVRPSMYEAHHDIIPVKQPAGGANIRPMDVVGPICETGDTFAKQRPLPPLESDDLVAFRSAGAYGAVMSSTYNARPLIPEVLVKGNAFSIIRKRVEVEEQMANERVPDWLKG